MVYSWGVHLDGLGRSSALLKAATMDIKTKQNHYRRNLATL